MGRRHSPQDFAEENSVATRQPLHVPRLQLSISTLVDKNAAVAEVGYSAVSRTGGVLFYVETGSSKREAGDRFSPEIGEQLAVARALQKLARQILRDANQAVKETCPGDH